MKYSDRIIIAIIIRKELGEYVTTNIYIYIYMQEEFIDYILWTVFQEKVYGFITNNFKKIYTNTKTKLRTYLLKKKIYIIIHNNKHILSEILFDLFQEKKIIQIDE
jgi:hypothetical protein